MTFILKEMKKFNKFLKAFVKQHKVNLTSTNHKAKRPASDSDFPNQALKE